MGSPDAFAVSASTKTSLPCALSQGLLALRFEPGHERFDHGFDFRAVRLGDNADFCEFFHGDVVEPGFILAGTSWLCQ
ncbi:MAG: hypothetical protein HY208_08585 [Nitrospirae bacterium]|nr:hypothetical protein [Nitrospirota bacterium]